MAMVSHQEDKTPSEPAANNSSNNNTNTTSRRQRQRQPPGNSFESSDPLVPVDQDEDLLRKSPHRNQQQQQQHMTRRGLGGGLGRKNDRQRSPANFINTSAAASTTTIGSSNASSSSINTNNPLLHVGDSHGNNGIPRPGLAGRSVSNDSQSMYTSSGHSMTMGLSGSDHSEEQQQQQQHNQQPPTVRGQEGAAKTPPRTASTSPIPMIMPVGRPSARNFAQSRGLSSRRGLGLNRNINSGLGLAGSITASGPRASSTLPHPGSKMRSFLKSSSVESSRAVASAAALPAAAFSAQERTPQQQQQRVTPNTTPTRGTTRRGLGQKKVSTMRVVEPNFAPMVSSLGGVSPLQKGPMGSISSTGSNLMISSSGHSGSTASSRISCRSSMPMTMLRGGGQGGISLLGSDDDEDEDGDGDQEMEHMNRQLHQSCPIDTVNLPIHHHHHHYHQSNNHNNGHAAAPIVQSRLDIDTDIPLPAASATTTNQTIRRLDIPPLNNSVDDRRRQLNRNNAANSMNTTSNNNTSDNLEAGVAHNPINRGTTAIPAVQPLHLYHQQLAEQQINHHGDVAVAPAAVTPAAVATASASELYQPSQQDWAALYNRHVEELERKDLEIAMRMSSTPKPKGVYDNSEDDEDEDEYNEEDEAASLDGIDLALEVSKREVRQTNPDEDDVLQMVLQMSKNESTNGGLATMDASFSFADQTGEDKPGERTIASFNANEAGREGTDYGGTNEEEEFQRALDLSARFVSEEEQELQHSSNVHFNANQNAPLPVLTEEEEFERVLRLSAQGLSAETPPTRAAAAVANTTNYNYNNNDAVDEEEELQRILRMSQEDEEQKKSSDHYDGEDDDFLRVLQMSQQEAAAQEMERETMELVLQLSRQESGC